MPKMNIGNLNMITSVESTPLIDDFARNTRNMVVNTRLSPDIMRKDTVAKTQQHITLRRCEHHAYCNYEYRQQN